MLLESVAVHIFLARARLTLGLLLQVNEYMLARRVVPEEERFAILRAAIKKVQRLRGNFVIEGFHALNRQRAFVLGRAVGCARDNAARIKFLAELRIGRSIGIFKILVAVEVIQIAPELVEAMAVRQMFFQVAEVVLAELCSRSSRAPSESRQA